MKAPCSFPFNTKSTTQSQTISLLMNKKVSNASSVFEDRGIGLEALRTRNRVCHCPEPVFAVSSELIMKKTREMIHLRK